MARKPKYPELSKILFEYLLENPKRPISKEDCRKLLPAIKEKTGLKLTVEQVQTRIRRLRRREGLKVRVPERIGSFKQLVDLLSHSVISRPEKIESFEELVKSKKLVITEELIVLYKDYNTLAEKYQVLKQENEESKKVIAELNEKLEKQISDEDKKMQLLLKERKKAKEIPTFNDQVVISSDLVHPD